MSDYESLKVADLKSLLKERGIPSNGLTRKAQYIEALVAADSEKAEPANDNAAATEPVPVAEDAGETVEEGGAHSVQDDAAATEVVASTNEPATVDSAPVVASQPQAEESAPIAATQELESDSDRKRKREHDETAGLDSEAVPKKTRTDTAAAQSADDQVETSVDLLDETSEHSVTAALYVKNLMRPLQTQPFEADLLALADPSNNEQRGAIVTLHLDALKSHAFVLCSSPAVARRLRSELHGKPYPQQETQRKALWVDYIPEQSLREWIEQEEQAGKDARFEVEHDHGVARLVEVGSRSKSSVDQAPYSGQGMPGAPSGPRSQRPTHDAEPTPDLPRDDNPVADQKQTTSFNKLDQYFRFTATKPKIYFQPVDTELADRRLDELDRETSRDWQGGRSWNRTTRLTPIDQLRRYTFDDGDKVVDGGMDFGGFGRRQGAGGTGGFSQGPPRGGGRGGGGGGRYRS